ncbi:MAG: hypothetical protein O7J95_15280 [Planctomycetota bacterium]|nr:hypothetical protein [Planctomycetota bacterium]
MNIVPFLEESPNNQKILTVLREIRDVSDRKSSRRTSGPAVEMEMV